MKIQISLKTSHASFILSGNAMLVQKMTVKKCKIKAKTQYESNENRRWFWGRD